MGPLPAPPTAWYSSHLAALRHPVEGAEDDPAAGVRPPSTFLSWANTMSSLASRPAAAPPTSLERSSGHEPWRRHDRAGVQRGDAPGAAADLVIEAIVGGQVVVGSSRLRAGTAQKITLNTISTSVMVLLGKTYGNHWWTCGRRTPS